MYSDDRPKTTVLPSGDQSGSAWLRGSADTTCGLPPSAEIGEMFQVLSGSLHMKAIVREAGDQRIMNTRIGWEVNCRRCDPSSLLCHKEPSLVLIQATRAPSLESSVRPAMPISRQ